MVPRREGRRGEPRRGVLLAAGESTRFDDENKLLAPVDGTPMVDAARTLLTADLTDVVVVVGHPREAVREALARLDIEFRRGRELRRGTERVGPR